MSRPLISARDVSEHLLERTGRAIMAGDFAGFAACFALPQEIDTFVGPRKIETLEELEATFKDVGRHYRSLGVTQLVRHCVDARFRDEDTVESTHETRLLNGDILAQAPFPVFSILKRTDEGWKIASGQYAIADAPAHNAALNGTQPERASTEQTKD